MHLIENPNPVVLQMMPLPASFRLILTALFIMRQTKLEIKVTACQTSPASRPCAFVPSCQVDETFFLVYYYALLLRVLAYNETVTAR